MDFYIIYVKKYFECDLRLIILQRAKRRLGEKEYNLFYNNCEHFAHYCKTGEHRSRQVESYKRIVGENGIAITIENLKLPVHRWFRYSAGFSAQWVETVITQAKEQGEVTVLDPFAGSGTTLLASEKLEVECYGIEAHPFVMRVAKAKLLYRTCPDA
ncbi:MAG: lecithin retinol acyltransferase family protein [Tolypothrix brevis GSE-NOS-MK-07-07A]|jgi:hypothetical protein|nr:lecithin retinol acyltransferase family protein [Tolypothrix brevis GSE-NOS-MK-07-07A]